jgi:hypothetical protein
LEAGHARCTRRHALNATRNAKSHLSLAATDLSIAKTVFPSARAQTDKILKFAREKLSRVFVEPQRGGNMRKGLAFLVMVASFGIILALPLAAQESADESQAKQAATVWLAIIDKASYGEAWDAAGQMIKSVVPKEQFENGLIGMRTPLGAIVSRKAVAFESKSTLPGMPDGEYVMVGYNSQFEKKQSASESIVMSREPDGVWRVIGYHFQ